LRSIVALRFFAPFAFGYRRLFLRPLRPLRSIAVLRLTSDRGPVVTELHAQHQTDHVGVTGGAGRHPIGLQI
jgi:hypothetical protein